MATIGEMITSPFQRLGEFINARPSGSSIRRFDVETRAVPVFDDNGDVVKDEVGLLPDNEEVLGQHLHERGERFNYIARWKYVHAVDLVEQVKNSCCQVDRRTCKQVHKAFRQLDENTVSMSKFMAVLKPKLKARLSPRGQVLRADGNGGSPEPAPGVGPNLGEAVSPLADMMTSDPAVQAGITMIVAQTLKELGIVRQQPAQPAPAPA